jgi:hypothetical protein
VARRRVVRTGRGRRERRSDSRAELHLLAGMTHSVRAIWLSRSPGAFKEPPSNSGSHNGVAPMMCGPVVHPRPHASAGTARSMKNIPSFGAPSIVLPGHAYGSVSRSAVYRNCMLCRSSEQITPFGPVRMPPRPGEVR